MAIGDRARGRTTRSPARDLPVRPLDAEQPPQHIANPRAAVAPIERGRASGARSGQAKFFRDSVVVIAARALEGHLETKEKP